MLLKYRLHDIKCEIKWAWQRVFRGYDDRAVWNLNTWFLEYVPKILKDMNDGRYGYPCDLDDDKWSQILTKMIDCFTEANEDTCTKKNKHQIAYDKMWEEFTNEYGHFGENIPQEESKDGSRRLYTPDCREINRHDWQKIVNDFLREDKKIGDYRDKKLHEGLDLFSKYFWNLWD